MAEPTTEAGKRLLRLPARGLGWHDASLADVLAIEAEARRQERQAIRAACKDRNPDHDDRWCRICTDMVDPVDD